MKKLIRAAAYVTDFIDSDELHRLVSYNKNFGSFNHYRQEDGMRLVTTTVDRYADIGPHGAVNTKDRYWQVVRNDDGELEVYEISESGEQLGNPFLLSRR